MRIKPSFLKLDFFKKKLVKSNFEIDGRSIYSNIFNNVFIW